jgi:hypothetical protein
VQRIHASDQQWLQFRWDGDNLAEWKASFRPPSVCLEDELDADNEGPARPRPFHFKRDAHWQLPHGMHLLFAGEALATAGEPISRGSAGWLGAAAFAANDESSHQGSASSINFSQCVYFSRQSGIRWLLMNNGW